MVIMKVLGNGIHINGQLREEGNYKDDKMVGLWKWYYYNGQLKRKETIKMVRRKVFGKSYYENGQLKNEGNYKDDKMEGLWKFYYETGQLKSEGNYKDGKLISEKCWDEKGKEIECE